MWLHIEIHAGFVKADVHICRLLTPASSVFRVLSFVWSLRDVQQSPFLFCFSQFALCRLEMGNRSKAEWMSCFARSPSLNGFQGWVRLCMCCLAECGCVCLRVCMCVICMYMQIYVYVPECLCACVPASLPLCLCFYQSARSTLEFLRIPVSCIYRTTMDALTACRCSYSYSLFWLQAVSLDFF